jgi:hypothetical protein
LVAAAWLVQVRVVIRLVLVVLVAAEMAEMAELV